MLTRRRHNFLCCGWQQKEAARSGTLRGFNYILTDPTTLRVSVPGYWMT